MGVLASNKKLKPLVFLYLIRLFWTISFAVLYSTLGLYLNYQFKFSLSTSAGFVGTFLGLNYLLPLVGGFLVQRYISNKLLFIICTLIQIVGCIILSSTVLDHAIWGLSLFLIGTITSVVCINMLIINLYQPSDKGRFLAFIWSFSGMNVGFFVGYIVSGEFGLLGKYSQLFLVSAIPAVISIFIILFAWKSLAEDKDKEPLLMIDLLKVCILLVGLTLIIDYVLRHGEVFGAFLLLLGVVTTGYLIYLIVKYRATHYGKSLSQFFLFFIVACIFWSVYFISPTALSLFIQTHVNLFIGGMRIAPQWVQSLNPMVIIIGGPLLCVILSYFESKKGLKVRTSALFLLGMLFLGVGTLLLYVGIKSDSASDGLSVFWPLASLLSQTIGEILIVPVIYSMVGELVPSVLQPLLTGVVMLASGIGSVIAGRLSSVAFSDSINTPLSFQHLFGWLSVVSIGTALFLLCSYKSVYRNLIVAANGYCKNYAGVSIARWKRLLVALVNAIGTGAVFYLIIYFVTELHFNVAKAGIIVSFYGVGTFAGSYFFGRLSDKSSPERISIVCLLGGALAFFVLPELRTIYLLIFNLFLMGFFSCGFRISNTIWLLDERRDSMPLNQLKIINLLRAVTNLGFIFFVALVLLFSSHGFNYIFYIAAILLALSSVYLLFFGERREGKGEVVKTFNCKEEDQIKSGNAWPILLCVFLVGLIFAQLRSAYAVYLNDNFTTMGVNAFSLLMVLNMSLIVFFQTPFMNMLGGFNKILLIGVGGFLSGLGMLILAFTSSFTAAILSCVIWTAGEMIFYSMSRLVCYQYGHIDRKGRVVGTYQLIYAASLIVGPGLGGIVYHRYSGDDVWYFSAFIGVVCLMICWVYRNRYAR